MKEILYGLGVIFVAFFLFPYLLGTIGRWLYNFFSNTSYIHRDDFNETICRGYSIIGYIIVIIVILYFCFLIGSFINLK
jgi:hypothetical protein